GNLSYPADVRESAKSGLGHVGNRHLNYLAESISMNVGGPQQDVKASSPLMLAESVGGVIVLGARESRVHGEGRQEMNIPQYLIAAKAPRSGDEPQGAGCERERDDEAESNFGGGKFNLWRAGCTERCTSGSEGGVM